MKYASFFFRLKIEPLLFDKDEKFFCGVIIDSFR